MRFRSAQHTMGETTFDGGDGHLRAALDLISVTGGAFVSVSVCFSSFGAGSTGFIATSGMLKARLGSRVVTSPGNPGPGQCSSTVGAGVKGMLSREMNRSSREMNRR
jgi:hypothetical protein